MNDDVGQPAGGAVVMRALLVEDHQDAAETVAVLRSEGWPSTWRWMAGPKEFALLECLMAAAGLLVSAEKLVERVWDEAADLFTAAAMPAR